MENMILATPVLSDAATITTSTAPATLPGENLKKMSIGQVWRSLDPENAYIVVDLLAAKSINLIALLGHSGTSRAYGRIRAAATEQDLTADPAYDSGNLPLRSHQSGYDASWASGVEDEQFGALDKNHFIKWLADSPQNFRFWRIDINDANAEWFDAGRLYISEAWQPSTNMNYGLAEGMIDPSRQARSVGGKSLSVERQKFRWCELTLSYASRAEMFEQAFDIEWARGATRDVLLIVDIDDADHLQKRIYYGTLKTLQPIVNTAFEIFEKTFRIEEITA
jgi:hypothetical protein